MSPNKLLLRSYKCFIFDERGRGQLIKMSIFQDRAQQLVAAYGRTLEQQMVKRGSYLACGDEELWKQVEALLREDNASQTHCLGVDVLKVMEESLKTKTPRAGSAKQVRARGGLQGLNKAFEVLEQAALNLYLGPWREEYKEVKMYSGMFTHYIKPVLSATQIEKLFGLLGYQYSTRREQLRLQSLRVSPDILDNLLHLSCAFFLARCECRLLLAALENDGGDAQWELCVVRERQRGHSLKVALDNTKRMMGVKQPLMESDAESEVDLYTDEQVNQGQRVLVVRDDDSSQKPAWDVGNSGSLSFQAAGDRSCVSALKCQLSSKFEAEAGGGSLVSVRRHLSAGEESVDAEFQPRSLQVGMTEAERGNICSCLRSPRFYLNECIECNAHHDASCAVLRRCSQAGHQLRPFVTIKESTAPPSHNTRTPELVFSGSSADMAALSLSDKPKSLSITPLPISYHDCCNGSTRDPAVACLTCRLFHKASCKDVNSCQTQHSLKHLGLCACGRTCSRKPMVLCCYCGNEFCKDCWYLNPCICTCGQTLEPSSSV
ncbi:spermatogenesis-associated protein 2-like protein isoform X1 [Nerophis ophidion]|uniref:spermatogenesis-associated protein 2-like protein isoform X1 n=2 Tax=Nerophis ophidion TaxID=159077 RepID=UPI002AE00DCB|nr:spermatogenesis-associated protein 2-like protein isoform X1 [Nerophis ophidion]